MKIYGFYHVACMNHWADVADEQLQILDRCGLAKATDRLYGSVLGASPDPFPPDPWGWDPFDRDPDILKFEFPTLSLLWSAAQKEEFYAYYFHTKGVRLGGQASIEAWRRMMNHFILERWQEAVKKLDEGYDCVGCEPGRMPWTPPQDYFHYGGNCWWATSRHIRRLPPVESLNLKHRELAEAWIGMAGDPHYYVAYRSGLDHNATFHPWSAYGGKGYE